MQTTQSNAALKTRILFVNLLLYEKVFNCLLHYALLVNIVHLIY